MPSLCAGMTTASLAWQTLTLLVLISLTIYVNFNGMGLCPVHLNMPNAWESQLSSNKCFPSIQTFGIITQLNFYYGPFELNLIKRLPGKHTLSPGVLYHWITLNIYDLLCLIYCSIAWWAKRQLFKIIMGRSFCDRRKRVFTVLTFMKTFDISTTKHHNSKGQNKIKIIRKWQWHSPELNCGEQLACVLIFNWRKSRRRL